MRGFFNKVAEHIDKLDAEGQRKQYRLLVEELSFYESVFSSLREGVLVVDAAGTTVYANEAVARLTGFDGAKAKGRPVRHILPDWDWDNLLAPSGEGQGWTRQASCEIEVSYPERRILEVQATPSVNGTVLLVRDVTLARAQEESARESSRTDAVRDLAAGVAHEIGNPLNAISLNLQLLAREFRREPDEERRTRLLHDIATSQNEVKRLEGIIKGFLSAIRPAKLNLVPGSILDPLTDTLDAMKAQFEDRRIQTQLNLPTALPTVLVDHAQMEQVFFNLVKNAIEAMKDGGSLDIEVAADDRDVHVVFRDNGTGMDAATLAHIFEPYQTSKEQGSGLGLMLSRRIVHAHGGEIDVESKPGAGTAFTVRIPRLEKRVRRLK
ncbi:MAG: PAS domain-containing protein [Kiritimatiellae bacterium]|nr:PAS domain-containing protein [Kiritimatiellia bacterium]